MPLAVEVGLGPGHIVLHGDPAPPPETGTAATYVFGRCLLWPRSPISATAELLFCLYELSWKLLNRFAPNSCGRRVLSLAWTSLKVKVKGQGHQGQKHIFRLFGGLCVVYVS